MFNAAFSRDLIAQREHELRELADLQHAVAAARSARRSARRSGRAGSARAAIAQPMRPSAGYRVAPAGCSKDPG